jgi:hypothetical protein
MARSKIIQDLANSKVDTMTALKRAKVLLSELGNNELLNWINYEIAGYPSEVILPVYRIKHGNLIGSYFKGSMASHMTWTNVSLPLGKMPDDKKDEILSVQFREGVEALKQLSENSADGSGQLGKVIPADFFSAIATYNDDPFMIITSARAVIGTHCILNIFSVIENRLLDVLILLEKEFGNLDELDLDVQSKTPEELQDITKQIIVIVYSDHSVNIGDGNKITRSDIASE